MKSKLSRLRAPLAATALSLTLAAPAMALEPFNAAYQASAMGMTGDGQMSLTKQDGGQWQYKLTIRNQLVDLSQSTVFDEQGGRLRPLSSDDSSRMLVKQKTVKTNFDWAKKQATWSGDVKPDRAGPVPLQAGDMDALLVNLAIARDVKDGKPLNYRMVEGGKVRPMTYKVLGKEEVTVNGKAVQATKVSRVDGKKEMVVWVVPNMPVPVRMLQRENGADSIDLRIKSVN